MKHWVTAKGTHRKAGEYAPTQVPSGAMVAKWRGSQLFLQSKRGSKRAGHWHRSNVIEAQESGQDQVQRWYVLVDYSTDPYTYIKKVAMTRGEAFKRNWSIKNLHMAWSLVGNDFKLPKV